ncbi:hypothetical protein, partial [Streptomyces griseorubiginosus]|uniref:hypothetical protein n=1 Tax=Streptomyces griseorubiginosus TaxID=67304 RepID=UPI001AD6DF16
TTDGIRDLPGNDDPTGHHSHGTNTPTPDQRKRVDHVRKDNTFLHVTSTQQDRGTRDRRHRPGEEDAQSGAGAEGVV